MSLNTPSRILLTGAAGIVGTALRPILGTRYDHVLLTDIVSIQDLLPNESYQQADLRELHALEKLCAQVDGIIHLGGMVGAAYGFEDVLGPNIIGSHHLFEAAMRQGVKRVIYASSHHVVGFVPRGSCLDHRSAPRPNGEYALSKAFGEAAASYYADKFGLEILSIRIGYMGDDLSKERRLHTWVSARDLAQLIHIGLTHPELHHEIVYGVSEVPQPFFDNQNATRLGYVPQDRVLDHIQIPEIFDRQPDLSTIEEGVVGGGFATVGFAGDPARVLARRES
jgi:uronate dehydrogenase